MKIQTNIHPSRFLIFLATAGISYLLDCGYYPFSLIILFNVCSVEEIMERSNMISPNHFSIKRFADIVQQVVTDKATKINS